MSVTITPRTDNKIRGWIREACAANQVPALAEIIYFKFNNRLCRMFGEAWIRKRLIVISTLLWKSSSNRNRRDTIIHETCHIIVYYIYGSGPEIKPHGEEWKLCMELAGCEPVPTGELEIKV